MHHDGPPFGQRCLFAGLGVEGGHLVDRVAQKRLVAARLDQRRLGFGADRRRVAPRTEGLPGARQQRRDQGLSTQPFYWGAFIAAGDWR